MKQTISILLASLALAVSGYLGWRIWQPELNGRWHIVEGGEDIGNPPITALHISSSGDVLVLRSIANVRHEFGETRRFFHEIRLGPPAHAAYFDISWSADTLLLSEMHPRHFLNDHKLTGRVMKGVR